MIIKSIDTGIDSVISLDNFLRYTSNRIEKYEYVSGTKQEKLAFEKAQEKHIAESQTDNDINRMLLSK